MIQRIQSVWLFTASFISGALFIFPLYHYTLGNTNTAGLMTTKSEYLLLVLASIMTVLPLVALFMFGNRKRQKGMVWLSILASAGFVIAMLMKIENLKQGIPAATNDNFALPGPIIPLISIVCLLLAFKGIRKDEELIKSVDRLR